MLVVHMCMCKHVCYKTREYLIIQTCSGNQGINKGKKMAKKYELPEEAAGLSVFLTVRYICQAKPNIIKQENTNKNKSNFLKGKKKM